ncbi:MAG: hypothetical protein MJ181_10780 [Treponema sp.]|nr:hypothetical protein [Treponema sp.]
MANSIAKFKKYVAILDEVYQNASKSAVMESDGSMVSAGANANEIIIPKMRMDGLANYSRNGGYVGGDVTITHETVQFNFDRGRTFQVDSMDNEETEGVAFGKLSAEFIRTKVVPELDAFRFAKYSDKAGTKKNGQTLSSGDDVISALIEAQSTMDEAEVPEEGRILFITPSLYNLVEALDTTKSREVLGSFSQIVKVPNGRFYTAITQKDGTTSGQEAGGFAKASGGADINFLVVEKSATIQYTKHNVSKAISPDENQDADAWKFFFRSYGLTEVYDNKVAGIYLNCK